MNNDEAEFLRQSPLQAPSAELDARMRKLFAAAPPARRPWFLARSMRVWQAVAACMLCAVSAFLAGAHVSGRGPVYAKQPEVRCVVQVEQRAFDVFDWTKYPKKMAPCSVLKSSPKLTKTS